MSTGWGVHADICSVWGCCGDSSECLSMVDVVDMSLTVHRNPEAWRGTGNSGLLIHWSGAWDFPTRLRILLIQPWSAVEACVCTTSHQGQGGEGVVQAYGRSLRKLFRGDSLPLNWANSINYLHWQMFTGPNMHEFVELAGFPQPNVLVFHDACRSSCYSGCFTESINLSCQHHQPLWWKLFHSLIRELWSYYIWRSGSILGGSVIM